VSAKHSPQQKAAQGKCHALHRPPILDVVAVATIDHVDPVSAEKHIVSGPAGQHIIVCTPDYHVVPVTGIEREPDLPRSQRSLYAFFTTRLRLFAPSLRDGLYLPTHRCNASGGTTMDWLYLAMVLGFFAASAALIHGCERLRR